MPRAKISQNDRRKESKAFFDFLSSSNMLSTTNYSFSISDLKEIYTSQYREQCKVASDDGDLESNKKPHVHVPFSTVIYTLIRLGTVHKHSGHIVFSKNFQDGLPRKGKRKLAVDQHLTIPAGVADADGDDPESTVNKVTDGEVTRECPLGVGRLGKNLFCEICRANLVNQTEMEKHVTGRKHRVQCLLFALRAKRSELVKDKHDIKVTSGLDFNKGCIRLDISENQPTIFKVTITNSSQDEPVRFLGCEFLKRLRVVQLDDSEKVTEGKASATIQPGEKYEVLGTAKSPHVGKFYVPLALQFSRDTMPGKPIHIVRYLSVWCSNSITSDLQPKVPYKRPPRVTLKSHKVEVIDGLPLPQCKNENLEKVIELDKYLLPADLRKLMNRGLQSTCGLMDTEIQNLQKTKNLLKGDIDMINYQQKFLTLLHIEEMQMEVDIRKYDMENVTMTVCHENPRLLTLQVPGLAENRPSVIKGDWLFVRCRSIDGSLDEKEYKGYVHEVRLNEVYLGFSQKLLSIFLPNTKFNVRFIFNRLPLRLQHRAAQLADEHSLDKLLFPTRDTCCLYDVIQPPDTTLLFYDKLLGNNLQQQLAVGHIVAGSSRPAPYLLFGPPGTGKTVTMVEAMKQVVHCIPSAHILACAPSNSAVDLLAIRLLKHLSKAQVFRIHALSRQWSSVPDEIRACSNYDKKNQQYFFPSKSEIVKYKVVVCTLITAGRIASANFPPGHFTHVFIDEAGHAVEPEAVIALAGILECDMPVLKDGGQVVLAGDPEQLGPVLRSPVVIKHGLASSLLERYMKTCRIYSKQTLAAKGAAKAYDSRLITKLIQNYRSHPDILKIPNDCFYESELEAHADVLLRESLCDWDKLPKRGFPIIFHGTVGEDTREERSPSFFNPEEVAVVIQYVQELLMSRGKGVKILKKEIGIISPYRKQVQKIQEILKQKNLSGIKVGSVEEFQGQERRVVIISTVRSNPEYLALDTEYKVGFLTNPKRFNVALTRAKALLIVIGNPYVLSKDAHWNKFLEFAHSRGGYTGCDFDDEGHQMEDVMQRFAAVSLDEHDIPTSSDHSSLSLSEISRQQDPEWRGED